MHLVRITWLLFFFCELITWLLWTWQVGRDYFQEAGYGKHVDSNGCLKCLMHAFMIIDMHIVPTYFFFWKRGRIRPLHRSAKHHWLAQPLPDQLPNTTQAHQTALLSFLQDLARTVRQIPTRYAPVRHFVLNYSDSSKRRPLGQSRSARPVVLKQGETTLARSLKIWI